AQYTTQLYQRLERETGQATGFRQVGSIAVAASEARFQELKRGASMARSFGLEVQILSPDAARERWPLLSTDGLVGAVFLPKDGRTNPVDTTQALARGARGAGVRIVENLKVTGIRSARGRVSGVATEAGEVRADAVVNCAGLGPRACGCSSMARRASRRTIGTSSARRGSGVACTWRRASIRSASSRPAGQARCSRTGFSTAIRPLTSGTSTSAAARRFNATGATCASVRWRRSASCTPCTG